MISDLLFREMYLLARNYKHCAFNKVFSKQFENILYSHNIISDNDKQLFCDEFKKVFWFDNNFMQNNVVLSEEFIEYFSDFFNWEKVDVSWFKLSEDFIRKFSDRINFNTIDYYDEFSLEFINEFKDKLNLKDSRHYNWTILDEDLINYLIDNNIKTIPWKQISLFSKMSIHFIRKYFDKLDVNLLMENDNIDNSIKEKFGVFI